MFKISTCAVLTLIIGFSSHAKAQDSAKSLKQGAAAYRICAACHSLQPGVHLSGPRLANIWGKKAGSVPDFQRNTKPLKNSDIFWYEDTLNAWLADPQAMVPGTTMRFRGIENDQTRDNLITFLRQAMAQDGAAKVVQGGLIPKDMADGQIPPSLKKTEADQQINSISHCGDAYIVTTADGMQYPFWETNLRIKIDTSVRGPKQGKPILLRSGMAGDRISVVFPSLGLLHQLLKEKCQG